MICPNCGHETVAGEVCQQCGTPFALAFEGPMKPGMPFPGSGIRDAVSSDRDTGYGPPVYTPDGVLRVFGVSSPLDLPPALKDEVAQGLATGSDVPTAPSPAPPTGHLIVHFVSDQWAGSAEEVLPLDGHDITIGRSPGCDIVIEDDILVSRHHAVIRYHDTGYMLVDLASSNGTLINGEPLASEWTLREGDRIRIGDCDIIYSTAPAPVLAPAQEPGATMADGGEGEPGVHEQGGDTDQGVEMWDAATTPLDGAAACQSVPVAMAQAPAPPPPAARDLDTLQAQLTNIVGQLRQQAEVATREAERLRAEVAAVSTTLAMLLQAERLRAGEGPDVPTLLQLAERTVESPRHLDNVVEFAAHAADIAAALRDLRDIRSSEGLIEAVDALRARLATAAHHDEDPSLI